MLLTTSTYARPLGVDEVVAPATLDPGRRLEVVLLDAGEDRVATGEEDRRVVGRGSGLTGQQAEQRGRVRAQPAPCPGQRRQRRSRRVEPRVVDPLDVDVRRQPIDPHRGDGAEWIARGHRGAVGDAGRQPVEPQVEQPGLDDDAVAHQPDPPTDGRLNRGARRREQVDPQVDRRGLVGRVKDRLDQACLPPPAERPSAGSGDKARDGTRVADGPTGQRVGGAGQVEDVRLVQPRHDRRDGELGGRPRHPLQTRHIPEHLGCERERHAGDGLEHRPLLVPCRVDVGVVRLEGALLVATDRHRRGPRHHHRPGRRQLRLGQREQGQKPTGDLAGELQRPGEIVDRVRRDRHRQLGGEPGPRQVAEVDEPDRHQPPARVAAGNGVEIRDVLVHDAHAKRRRQGFQRSRSPFHRPLSEGPARLRRGKAQQGRDDRARVPDVPLERTIERGMIPPLERLGDPRGHRTVGAQHWRRQVPGCIQRLACDPGDQAQVMGVARRRDRARDERSIERRLRDRHREWEPGPSRVEHRGILGLERRTSEPLPGDLEHQLLPRRRGHQVVAVLVTAELAERALPSEVHP